jgi:hypothetical protein
VDKAGSLQHAGSIAESNMKFTLFRFLFHGYRCAGTTGTDATPMLAVVELQQSIWLPSVVTLATRGFMTLRFSVQRVD